jgi:hypothetical protein
MAATRVVPALDPREDLHARLREGLLHSPIDELALEAAEEALCHRLVIGVADAAHRGAYTHADLVPETAFVGLLHEWGDAASLEGVCLMLRHAASAPAMGVQLTLYEPKLTDIGHDFFKLRGFEPAQEGAKFDGVPPRVSRVPR